MEIAQYTVQVQKFATHGCQASARNTDTNSDLLACMTLLKGAAEKQPDPSRFVDKVALEVRSALDLRQLGEDDLARAMHEAMRGNVEGDFVEWEDLDAGAIEQRCAIARTLLVRVAVHRR